MLASLPHTLLVHFCGLANCTARITNKSAAGSMENPSCCILDIQKIKPYGILLTVAGIHMQQEKTLRCRK